MANYDIPEHLRYSEEDEWARLEGNRVTTGITDYAQQQLGDIVYVELPEVGRVLDAGEPFGVIESDRFIPLLFAEGFDRSVSASRILLPAALFMFLSNFSETTLAGRGA